MASSQDSSPNFDFLGDDEEASFVNTGDSATNLLESPAAARTPAADNVLDSSTNMTSDQVGAAEVDPATDGSVSETQILPEEHRPKPTAPAARFDERVPKPATAAEKVRTPPPTDKKPLETSSPNAADEAPSSKTQSSKTQSSKTQSSKTPSSKRSENSRGKEPRTKDSRHARGSRKPTAAAGFDWDGIVAAGGKAVVLGLASYAALTTLLLLWSLMGGGASSSTLESLPDVPPREPNSFQYVPPSTAVPVGHRVGLGGSRQFGHILVEPLAIERDGVELSHYSGANRGAPPSFSGTPLKLRVRFTNQSPATAAGQVIAPLDRALMYERLPNASGQVVSNQYLYNAGDPSEPAALMLPLAATSEWEVAGQTFPKLAPGESIETTVAAGPNGLDALGDNAIWRLQIRKGFHAASGHGVTTLVEVPFDATAATAG